MNSGDDFQILVDRTEDGVRHITAIPSTLVCSSQIDFDIVDGRLRNVVYKRGCDGNLQAIGRLVEGQPVATIADKLLGINCHGRGTACGDQLARILKAIE